MPQSISFLFKHLFAHVFLYILPRTVYKLVVELPTRVLGVFFRSTSSSLPDERAILIISSRTDHRVREEFGLTDGMRYNAPLYAGDVQTMLGGMRVPPKGSYIRELVEAYGGQHVHMDYLYPANPKQAIGMIYVVPGMLNASTTNYIRHFAEVAVHAGFAVCVQNVRGMGSTPLEVPRLFSATFTDDVRYCLAHYLQPKQVQERLGTPEPVPLLGLGFSLGGVILMKYIGEQGKAAGASEPVDTPLEAAFAYTSPFDLVASDESTQKTTYHLFYEKPFAVGLRKYVKHNQAMLEKLPNVDADLLFKGSDPMVNHIASIRLFDEYINTSHNGFKKTEDYYRAADSLPWLRFSRTPVLCLSDANDPVCGPPIPSEQWQELADANPNVTYACMPVGGHLGFIGNPLEEWRGDANEGEKFVLHAFTHFCQQKKKAE